MLFIWSRNRLHSNGFGATQWHELYWTIDLQVSWISYLLCISIGFPLAERYQFRFVVEFPVSQLTYGYILLLIISVITSLFRINISRILIYIFFYAYCILNSAPMSLFLFFFLFIHRTTSGFLMFSESKRFCLYMIYAWGLSSMLTIIVFVLDSTPSLSESLRPGIGVSSCFLKSMHTILTNVNGKTIIKCWLV